MHRSGLLVQRQARACIWQRASGRLPVVCQAVTTSTGSTADAFIKAASGYAQTHPAIQSKLEPVQVKTDMGERAGLAAKGDIKANEVVLLVPEALAVTSVDAEKQELVGSIAASCSELVALTLWLMAERAAGQQSQYSAFLSTLPSAVSTSPLLWDEADLKLLTGSTVLSEARSRTAALKSQWAQLESEYFSDKKRYNPGYFNERSFLECFTVIVAHAAFLPSANCFALVPLTPLLGRTGSESVGCTLDYNTESQTVELRTVQATRRGQDMLLFDGRPNGELLLSTGSVEANNPSDFINMNASLVQADRYYSMKAQILETLGMGPKEAFPVYADRMPIQLFSYLRLARVSDPALFAKVSFDQDVQLSQMNEYEILQILMGDCRERLAAYPNSYEEDIKLLQSRDLRPNERVAAKLRMAEMKLLNSTMEAVRRRLAPIRGIPTKSGGMADPNSDLKEIFDTIESIPSAPKKLVDGFLRWASGADDEDWNKGKKGKR